LSPLLPREKVKLLLDENLSDRIVPQVLDRYPHSAHVKAHNLVRTDDAVIWTFARQHNFVIVSKDSDFHQRSLVYGAPPKFIFLRVGNCPTSRIVQILPSDFVLISTFHADPNAAILILS
jgi:predicted nuclease of predicted toxin-antitoxin system